MGALAKRLLAWRQPYGFPVNARRATGIGGGSKQWRFRSHTAQGTRCVFSGAWSDLTEMTVLESTNGQQLQALSSPCHIVAVRT